MTDDELMALIDGAPEFVRRTRCMEDFRYDEQQDKYWDTTTGNILSAKSVDGAIPKRLWPARPSGGKLITPSMAINDVDTGLTVEGSTWWPGQPKFLQDVVVTERGAMPLPGACCYNMYIAPDRTFADVLPSPQPWIDHIKLLWPDPLEHEHFFDFCAHMLQRPDEKVNHGLVLSGAQGIGKDTALVPIRRGVGEWNAAEVGPDAIVSAYNGHVKSVVLVINEVRPHDEEYKASNFYNVLKPLLASPPEMLPMTLKYMNTLYVRNLCHVILTTNDPLSMYIPPEDRRLFVMTSPLDDPKVSGTLAPAYFVNLYTWLDASGSDSVIHWLLNRPLPPGLARTPPPMTKGKLSIIDSATQVRRNVVDDLWDDFCDVKHAGIPPQVFFHKDLADFAKDFMFDDAAKTIAALNAKNFHFKMAERGYDMVKPSNGTEWRHGKFRCRVAFADRKLPRSQQLDLLAAALAAKSQD